MAVKDAIIEVARNYLRDFPHFFQVSFAPAGRTYQLGHVNVDPDTLWVASVTTDVATDLVAGTDYDLDARNGVLRLTATPTGVDNLLIEGSHYQWVPTADLGFYADVAINYHTHNLKVPAGNLAPAVVNVIGIYTLVQALWGLLGEYSRDIDVITSESVHIPASQRFRMVQSLLDQWSGEYNKQAQALNIGLDRIEVVNLRRVSKLTNRLVPLFESRELGDYAPYERLWPEIDDGVINLEDKGDDLREEVYVDDPPPSGLVNQTWAY
jgi:hypothetical protein